MEDDDAKENTNGGEEDAELNEEQNEAPSPLVDAVQGGDLAADDAEEEEEEAMDVDEVSIIYLVYYYYNIYILNKLLPHLSVEHPIIN